MPRIETAQQYEQYCKDVAAFMESEGINCLTVDEGKEEPYFSWCDCDCCGDSKGGDRYDCSGFNPDAHEVQDGYTVCGDCVYYSAYGELGDDTMIQINQSEQPKEWPYFLEGGRGAILRTGVPMTEEQADSANAALRDMNLKLTWHPMEPD